MAHARRRLKGSGVSVGDQKNGSAGSAEALQSAGMTSGLVPARTDIVPSHVVTAGGSPQSEDAGVLGAPPRITHESAALRAHDSSSDQESLMSHVSSATAKLKDE